MTIQQQGLRPDQVQARDKRHKRLSQRILVIITVIIFSIAVAIIWILGTLKIISDSWASIASIIISVLGAVFTILQALHLFLPDEKHESPETSIQASAYVCLPATPPPSPLIPPINVQLPTTQPPSSDKASYRGIVGLPPPTDPRTIQQRERAVKAVYTQLSQTNITAIALTGIGGVGKSTLAALVYRYTEERRRAHQYCSIKKNTRQRLM